MAGSARDTDPLLYHYTTLDAFASMAEKRMLWASHVRYLNDTSEQRMVEEILAKGIERQFDDADRSKRERLVEVIDFIRSPRRVDVYVVSFSKDGGDRLSQWRGYSGGAGVAVGFKREEIEKRCKQFSKDAEYRIRAGLRDVEYIDPAIGQFSDRTLDFLTSRPATPALSKLSKEDGFKFTIAFYASAMKHQAFIEEDESRIIIMDLPGCREPKFRVRKSLLVPYREFPIGGGDLSALIGRVVIGPCPHKDESVRAVESMLRSYKIEVLSTATPFRDW